MPTMTNEQIKDLLKIAADHDSRCDRCNQTIRIYRYSLNKNMATFMRAMADSVRNSGSNDVDISTIGLPYSLRTQVTKIRLHGLIARIKDGRGVQVPSHWLITHKGWDFLNGKQLSKRVISYNDQVLGHDDGTTTIHEILGERFNPTTPKYEETPITAPEAKVYEDVRLPRRQMIITAVYKGRADRYHDTFQTGQEYSLTVERLELGKPVQITSPIEIEYHDIAAFQREWRIAK